MIGRIQIYIFISILPVFLMSLSNSQAASYKPFILEDLLKIKQESSDIDGQAILDFHLLELKRRYGDLIMDPIIIKERLEQIQNLNFVLSKSKLSKVDFAQNSDWSSEAQNDDKISRERVLKLREKLSQFLGLYPFVRDAHDFFQQVGADKVAQCLLPLQHLARGLNYMTENLIRNLAFYEDSKPSPVQFDLLNQAERFVEDFSEIEREYPLCFRDIDADIASHFVFDSLSRRQQVSKKTQRTRSLWQLRSPNTLYSDWEH